MSATFLGTNMLITLAFCLIPFLSPDRVTASPHKKIAAFYNGDCSSTVPNPCQICVDIKGGGFVCDCPQGWKLGSNGFSCLKDKTWKPDHKFPPVQSEVVKSEGERPEPSAHGDTQNQSGPKEQQVVEGGSAQDVRLVAQNPPDPLELGAPGSLPDNDVVLHRSQDMKAGLDPPQAMYQVRENGADALDNNVWPDYEKAPLPPLMGPPDFDDDDNDDENIIVPPPYFDEGDPGRMAIEGGEVVEPPRASSACDGIACLHNGSCVVEEGYARCNCPLGFAGSYCERELEVRFPRFRGTGYLALPVLRDGYKEFAVAMEFRPEAKNGLLLFSSEFEDARKDFFAITLNNGLVEFRFDCGTGQAVLVSPVPVRMGQWNQLIVARNENRGSLQLNGADVVEGIAQGAFTRITLRQNLYIGGYSRMTSISARVNTSKTFVGCVQHLIINGYRYDFRKGGLVGDSEFGVNVGECSEGLCERVFCHNGGTCHAKTADTHVCLCPLGFHGDECEKETAVQIPRFNGHSHLEFKGLGRSVLAFTELEVVVKPEGRDGLILYNGYTHDRKGDFIALSLRQGHVEFSFDLGTGPALIRSDAPLRLHHWHVIRASRTGLEGVLRVDEGPEVKGQSRGAYTQLTLLQNLFLGGHHNLDHTSRHANLSSSFVGCIQKIVINKRPLALLEDNVGGRNVEPCQHPCEGEPCMNGGECRADGEVYQCACPLGYTNSNCEQELERLPTKPMFSGSSFLMYTNKDIVKRVTGNKMDLQLYIKPRGRSGLLFWSGQEPLWEGVVEESSANFDYVALGFVDGSLQLRFNLGSGEALIGYNDTRLFDGKWHFIRVQRDNQDAYMEVDWRQIVEGSAPGTYTMLNTNRVVYLGGMPDVAKATGRRFTSSYEGCLKDMLLATDFKVKLIRHANSGRNVVQCRKHLDV
ncbi:LOW QUALITY PROTEIN: pikachurin-like [Babylonia areolata]|uniref:LOW QUALITY PROTEIN: pikachurin-like n=1 Tax=Babylonia areolata TaxID=304850 RepID=UPI003FD5FEE0